MLIKLKNKDTLKFDDFKFKCCIGKNGTKQNKLEGDKSTPKGTFAQKFVMGKHRDRVVKKSVNKAFELLYKEILNF